MTQMDPEALRRLQSVIGQYQEVGFPVECPSCQYQYETLDSFLQETQDPNPEAVEQLEANDGKLEDGTKVRIVRQCGCGCDIFVVAAERRDNSPQGQEIREAFAKSLDWLGLMGVDQTTARQELLKVAYGEQSDLVNQYLDFNEVRAATQVKQQTPSQPVPPQYPGSPQQNDGGHTTQVVYGQPPPPPAQHPYTQYPVNQAPVQPQQPYAVPQQPQQQMPGGYPPQTPRVPSSSKKKKRSQSPGAAAAARKKAAVSRSLRAGASAKTKTKKNKFAFLNVLSVLLIVVAGGILIAAFAMLVDAKEKHEQSKASLKKKYQSARETYETEVGQQMIDLDKHIALLNKRIAETEQERDKQQEQIKEKQEELAELRQVAKNNRAELEAILEGIDVEAARDQLQKYAAKEKVSKVDTQKLIQASRMMKRLEEQEQRLFAQYVKKFKELEKQFFVARAKDDPSRLRMFYLQNQDTPIGPAAGFFAAERHYEVMRVKDARELYEDVASDFPKTIYAPHAKTQLDRLKANQPFRKVEVGVKYYGVLNVPNR